MRSGAEREAAGDADDETCAARRILVVDDDWGIVSRVQRVLRGAGYVVDEVVTSAGDALAAFARGAPECVVLDVHLGRAPDGVELAEQIRARSDVPIVFMSAHCEPALLRRALRTGPQGYVVKPFTDAQLLTAVQMAQPRPPGDDARRTLDRIAAVLVDAGFAGAGPRPSAPHPVPSTTSASVESLTRRERTIVERLLGHQRVPGIARSLSISEHTVRNHLKSIYAKLGVHSQEELLHTLTRRP
jgi:DNA-binding NarL/FixJ family response regulator